MGGPMVRPETREIVRSGMAGGPHFGAQRAGMRLAQ